MPGVPGRGIEPGPKAMLDAADLEHKLLWSGSG